MLERRLLPVKFKLYDYSFLRSRLTNSSQTSWITSVSTEQIHYTSQVEFEPQTVRWSEYQADALPIEPSLMIKY